MHASWIEYYGWSISKKHGQNVSCHYDQYYLIFLPYWVQNVKNFRRGRLEDITIFSKYFQTHLKQRKSSTTSTTLYLCHSVLICPGAQPTLSPQALLLVITYYSFSVCRWECWAIVKHSATLVQAAPGSTPHTFLLLSHGLWVSPGTLLSGAMW